MNKIGRLGFDKLGEMFEDAFRKIVESEEIGILDFECNVTADVATDPPTVEVTVFGLAGAVPREQIHNVKDNTVNPKIAEVTVDIGGSTAVFDFVNSFGKNVNDYMLVYKMRS